MNHEYLLQIAKLYYKLKLNIIKQIKCITSGATAYGLTDITSNNLDNVYIAIENSNIIDETGYELYLDYIDRLINFNNMYYNRDISYYKLMCKENLLNIMLNTSFSLTGTTSTQKGYDACFSFEKYNTFIKQQRTFTEINSIHVNVAHKRIGVLFANGRFVPNVDSEYKLLLYVSSYITSGVSIIYHNWVHFHMPDLMHYNVNVVIKNKTSNVYSFLKPYVEKIPITNNNGISFETGRSNVVLLYKELMAFDVNKNAQCVTETTLNYYKTYSLNILFNVEKNIWNKQYIETHETIYKHIQIFVKNVFNCFTQNEKDELRQIFVNVSSNIEGLRGCEATDTNVIKLISKFIHQVSFIHSTDHELFYRNLKDRQTVLYFREPLSTWKLEKGDIYMAQLLIEIIAHSDFFKDTMDNFSYDVPFLQKHFCKMIHKLNKTQMFGLSLSDIHMSISM
jgi:hypothetical protein